MVGAMVVDVTVGLSGCGRGGCRLVCWTLAGLSARQWPAVCRLFRRNRVTLRYNAS